MPCAWYEGMTDTPWQLFHIWGMKAHFVPHELYEDLKTELIQRVDAHDWDEEDREIAGGINLDLPQESAWCDLPGIVRRDRSLWEHKEDPVFTTPTTDFSYYRNELRDAPLRYFASGAPYYKIHGWLHCVVFTPAQREALLAAMDTDAEAVRVAAEAEEKEMDEARQRLVQAGVLAPRGPTGPVGGEWN